MVVQRVQYAVKISEQYDERKILHFETDSDAVLIGNTNKTLTDTLQEIATPRKTTLSGDVTGTITASIYDDVEMNVEVNDDSHVHTGGTLDVGEAGRVVITAEDGSVTVSDVTSDELTALSGVTGSIQDQLDNKIKASETNGNVLVDGDELEVYRHPELETPFEWALPPEGEETKMVGNLKVNAIKNLEVDPMGHITKLETETFLTRPYSVFYLSSNEPTDQEYGDFWLELLSVEVDSGYYVEPTEPEADLKDIEPITPKTEDLYALEHTETGIQTPAGSAERYSLSDPV